MVYCLKLFAIICKYIEESLSKVDEFNETKTKQIESQWFCKK